MRKAGLNRMPKMSAIRRNALKSGGKTRIRKPITPVVVVDDLDAAENIDEFLGQRAFVGLSQRQVGVLKALIENFLSDTPRSDSAIARDLNVHHGSISRLRNTPTFAMAFNTAVFGALRGKMDRFILRIIDMAEAKNDWRVYKFILELAGLYVPKMQSLNVNVDVQSQSASQFASVEDVAETFIIRLGELGWTEEDFVNKYRELKAQQAF